MLAGFFALILATSALVAPAATAVVIGPYNIDGIVPDDTDPDLTPIVDPNGNTKELGPLNASTTKIGVIHSDALPTLGETNPNAQVDLNTTWLDTERVSGNDFLYFAWQRDKDTGSGFIAYEFMRLAAPTACAYDTATQDSLIANCNPWSNRQAGDFLILWDQQGGSTTLFVRRWEGTAPNLTLSGAVELTNYDAEYSADGFRGEAAINLTANGMGSGGNCLAFANVIPSTVTGNSDTADYKDTILKKINLTNCTSTTVTTPQTGAGGSIPADGLDLGANGVSVRDSAVITPVGGTADPVGTVTFYLCGPLAAPGLCTTGGNQVGAVKTLTTSWTVASDAVTVTQPGRYCFRAVYSGDVTAGIGGSSDSSATECFIVKAVQATLTSAQTWVPNDSVTVSAPVGGDLAGTVSFVLYPTGNCTGTAIYTANDPTDPALQVAGSSPRTVYSANTTAVSASGTYSWKVGYVSTNPAQLSIAPSCHETSALTITNGGTVPSPSPSPSS